MHQPTSEEIHQAKIIWNYTRMNQTLSPTDAIIGLGSHDTRTAERCAELYYQKLAPYLIFTGGYGRVTKHNKNRTEAQEYADIAMKAGIPAEAIFLETESTNTGENISFTKNLITDNNLTVTSAIVVNKPYMERRTYATFRAQWPELEIMVTSPQLSFEECCDYEMPMEKVISIMVGDVQRIKEYPARGFQIEQNIPVEVWTAFQELSHRGYTEFLIN